MAATDVAEFVSQVGERLGLRHPSAVDKLSKAVGNLDLAKSEVDRIVDAVNIELARIYAERHVAETMHAISHEIVETVELNDHWEVGKPKKGEAFQEDAVGQQWVNRPVKEVTRTNAIDHCPDCHRELVGARDQDSTVPVLVCSRLAGLKIGLANLTPHDIVACGIPA